MVSSNNERSNDSSNTMHRLRVSGISGGWEEMSTELCVISSARPWQWFTPGDGVVLQPNVHAKLRVTWRYALGSREGHFQVFCKRSSYGSCIDSIGSAFGRLLGNAEVYLWKKKIGRSNWRSSQRSNKGQRRSDGHALI